MGTYFLNPSQAYEEAKQQKRTGLYKDLQICYYHGEKLDSDLPNLIHLPLEHIYDYMSETDNRMIGTFRQEPHSDSEFNNKVIEYIQNAQKEAIAKKHEFIALFKQEIKNMTLNFNEPLRIFFITSRATTVLQHSAKGLCDAFKDMGYETFLSIEHNDMQSWGVNQESSYFVWHLKNMYDFKPHIVINIDFLHNDFLPNEMFNIIWFQDNMPIFEDKTKRIALRERDFVYHLVKGVGDILIDFDIKSEYQGFLINEKIFTEKKNIKKEKKIVFIGSSYYVHLEDIINDPIFNIVYAEMVEIFESQNFISNQNIATLMKKYGKPSLFFGEISRCLSRDYCVEKLCRINTGQYKVEIYGSGWEDNKYVRKFHKGMVSYGEDICNLYNSATYGYCVGGYVLMQRTLECVFSGTIPLVLDVRNNPQDKYDEKIEEAFEFFNIKELEKVFAAKKPKKKDFSFVQQEFNYKKFASKIIDTVKAELHP